MRQPKTVGELREMLTSYPDDMPVFVDGYEHGLIAIGQLFAAPVAEQPPKWLDSLAPMMGTHDLAQKCDPGGGPMFAAVILSRNAPK